MTVVPRFAKGARTSGGFARSRICPSRKHHAGASLTLPYRTELAGDLLVGKHLAVAADHLAIRELVEACAQRADPCDLTQVFSGQDAAIFCLGAYTGSVSYVELRSVTVDYPIEFARSFEEQSHSGVLVFKREQRRRDKAKQDGLRTRQRRSGESAARGWLPSGFCLSVYLHPSSKAWFILSEPQVYGQIPTPYAS